MTSADFVLRGAEDSDARPAADLWLRSFVAPLPTVRCAHDEADVRDWFARVLVQRPHLADRAGDCGPVDAEPAGQHVVRGTVAKVDERGQEPVDKDQLVLCAGAHDSLAWPGLAWTPVSPDAAHAITDLPRRRVRRSHQPTDL